MMKSLIALFLLVASMFLCHESADAQATAPSSRQDVYIVPFSHLDLFWAGTREECLARGNRIIAKALGIAKAHPEFRFLMESDNFVDNYVQSHQGSPELEDLKRLVNQGRIEIAPNWANIFLNQPDGEVLARNLLYGTHYAKSVFGVDPKVFHPADIPGFAAQLPQILSQAGIPSMVMTRLGPQDRSLFRWEAPNGSRVLVWNEIRGYDFGVRLNLHKDMTDDDFAAVRKALGQMQTTTSGPLYLPWGLDLWAPTDKLVSNVDALNRRVSGAHFALATPQEFFAAASPEPVTLHGEIPLGWPHVIDSILHLWQLAVPATNTLENAEKFAAINYAIGYAEYPQAEMESLWKSLIESMDHNHDGQGGETGDQEKMADSQRVIIDGGEILRHLLRNIAERIQHPIKNGTAIVVFNPLGWKRDGLVKTHATLYGDVAPAAITDYKKGVRLVDESGNTVPFYLEQTSDNISRALDMVFMAQDVPSLGYRTYFLVPSEQPAQFPLTSTVALDRDNDLKEPRRPLGVDVIENRFYRLTIDKATGGVTIFDKELNRDVTSNLAVAGVEERGTNNVQREIETGRTIPMIVKDTAVEENTPVSTVTAITGQVGDVPVVQRLTLYSGLKQVDVENSITWKEPRFLNIQQLLPVPKNADIRFGAPFGVSSLTDVMPGSGPRAGDEIQKEAWQKYRTIQSWIFAGGPDYGITLAADHQLIEVEDGLIRCDMIRGQRYTSVKIVRGEEVTSIHFPPPGTYVFRYSITSGSGDWKAVHSYRAGQDLTNPLIPVEVVDDLSAKSLPPTYSFLSLQADNLMISAVKRAETGHSLIVRVYETAGSSTDTSLLFRGKPCSVRGTNLLEMENGIEKQRVGFRPFEIKTLILSETELARCQ